MARAAAARAPRTAHGRPARTAPARPARGGARTAPARRKSGPAPRKAAPRPARAAARPAPRRRAAAAPRGALLLDRLLRGRGWVACVGVLLAGIVFLNVSVLELNEGIARTSEKVSELQRDNVSLRKKYARLSSSERIQNTAAERGLVLPAPGKVRYLRSQPTVDGRRAAQVITKPKPQVTPPPEPVALDEPATAAPGQPQATPPAQQPAETQAAQPQAAPQPAQPAPAQPAPAAQTAPAAGPTG
jgi:hypothetical protein